MDKAEMRKRLRHGEPPAHAVVVTVVELLFGWMSSRLPGTAAAYLAMGHEIDVSTLFERLPGWRWVLPRVEVDHTITFRDRDVPREIHRFGMEQPTATGPVIPVREIDVFLVPGVAFGEDGRRLGHGAGFYDGILVGKRSDGVSIGVTVEGRLLHGIPESSRDQRVEWLVSEAGIRRCSTNSPARS